VNNAFLERYTHTKQLIRRMKEDKSRFYFEMLIYFDLVKIIYPERLKRVKSVIKKALEDFFKSIFQDINIEKALHDIEK
jgi:hypothetical protein